MKIKNKIIIGSGLVGPLLSIYLSQRDYFVDLYEKRSDLRKNNVSVGRSINLALSHRGIKALKSAKVFDRIEPLLIPMKGRMIHFLDGNIEFQPYSIYSHEYINSVSRGKLNHVLMNYAEETGKVNIHFKHSLSKIDEKNNELIFKNGKKIIISDHIFGADGAGSIIRSFIDLKLKYPSYTKSLGHEYKELHISPNKNGDFKMDPNALHIWPREKFMLIALPNLDKSFTCTLFLPARGTNSFSSISTPSRAVEFFSQYFSDVLPLLDNFQSLFFENPTGKLATVYSYNWQYNNQFCLVGDAAHTIVPFFGQGMNASFEDCEVFIEYLDKFNGKWKNTLENYSSSRKIDGHAIADMAIENYLEMRDLVVRQKFIKNKKIANILWEKFPDRFIPRYNMVSFTSIPYSEVYKRGKIQSEIVNLIYSGKLDFEQAKRLIMDKLKPIK